jgi:hypothetical protein
MRWADLVFRLGVLALIGWFLWLIAVHPHA